MTDLILKTERAASAEEVEDLITGTGALSYDWWTGAERVEQDGVAGWEFTHDDGDSDEGAGDVLTWVSDQQILDAAGRFLAEGRLQYNVTDVMIDSIGYLDAPDADLVLQYAVFGRGIFG